MDEGEDNGMTMEKGTREGTLSSVAAGPKAEAVQKRSWLSTFLLLCSFVPSLSYQLYRDRAHWYSPITIAIAIDWEPRRRLPEFYTPSTTPLPSPSIPNISTMIISIWC
jgi:hypothetical protein